VKKEIVLQKLLRLARDERGSELVEFAVTALVLIFLLIGVFQWILAMYAYHFTTFAAQEGARFAMVRGNTWSQYTPIPCSTEAPPNFRVRYQCTASSTDIQNYVQSLAIVGISRSNVTINMEPAYIWPGTAPNGPASPCISPSNSPGCLVRVSVSYTLRFLPFPKSVVLPISAVSEQVILQ
jgi:Flp pilus assembly protein TadG